jgi:hypothetical protein
MSSRSALDKVRGTVHVGVSAREQAARLRAKARRLDDVADRYQRGALGEEATARLLATLDPARFRVFHDIRLPGSRANVDHVVIGPTGLFVVDSKNYTAPVSVSKATLWCGRHPQTKRVETARWEAGKIVEALRLDGDVPTPRLVLCIHGQPSSFETAEVDGALVVAPELLVGTITNPPDLLTPHDCARLAASIPRRLGPDARSPSVARRPPTTPRRPRRSGRRRRSRAGQDLAAAAAGVAMLLFVAPRLIESAMPEISTTATTTTAVASPRIGAPSLKGTYSCPRPGAGWQLALTWPGNAPGYVVEWRSRASAPWTRTTSWRDAATPWTVGAIAPGTPLAVRARAVTDEGMSEWAEASFGSPATRC